MVQAMPDVYTWQDPEKFSPRQFQGSHSLHPSLVLHAWQHPPEELLAFLHTCHHLRIGPPGDAAALSPEAEAIQLIRNVWGANMSLSCWV